MVGLKRVQLPALPSPHDAQDLSIFAMPDPWYESASIEPTCLVCTDS